MVRQALQEPHETSAGNVCPPSTTLHVHNSLEDSTTSEESDDGNRASDLNSEEGADDDDDGGWS